MLEFIVGYVVGSSSRESAPMSWKGLGIALLVLMALSGFGYLMLASMSPSEKQQCGGMPIDVMMCNLQNSAGLIGFAMLGFVALVVGVGVVLSLVKSK